MILNLTQHNGTQDQGVIEPTNKAEVQTLLTFNTLPSRQEIVERATALANIASAICPRGACVMIGGAPFLMPTLEKYLILAGLNPVYAFSVRTVQEQTQPDGTTRKVAIFKHAGWIGAI